MLAPRVIIFTASDLLGSPTHSAHLASEALVEIERRNIPLVLATRGTRTQIELLRRKLEHAHPFVTEGGGGLFIPDGYFALRLVGAKRAGRYFCVPFGRSSQEAAAAVEDIAQQAGAEVVRYAEMNAREIARETGMTIREAEGSRERDFSERFFLAGSASLTVQSFAKIARERKWQIRRSEPFWELYSGNDEGKAVRYLMRVYRKALRSRIRSVGIGGSIEDLSLLAATDQVFILPFSSTTFDENLLSKLPHGIRINVTGAPGWNQTVMNVLRRL